MLIDFYTYSIHEIIVWAYIWKALLRRGVEAHFIVEPPGLNTTYGSKPDKTRGYLDIKTENLVPLMTPDAYKDIIGFLQESGYPYETRGHYNADAVVTALGIYHLYRYRGLKLRTLYGSPAHKDAFGYHEINKGLDAVFVHGDFTRECIQKWLPAEDVIITGYPKYSLFFRGEVDTNSWSKRFRLDPNKKTVVYFSTWAHNSSLDSFAEEIAQLGKTYNVLYKPHHNNLHFEYERYDLLRKVTGVIVEERVRTIVPFYAVADIVLADARSGSFTEAFLTNRPVIGLSPYDDPEKDYLIDGIYEAAPVCRNPHELPELVAELIAHDTYIQDRQKLARYLFTSFDGRDDEVTADGIIKVVRRKTAKPAVTGDHFVSHTSDGSNSRAAPTTSNGPTFSIIIPTHNRSAILRKCLDALAVQTFSSNGFEVFVCDDGSTDDTEEIIKGYSSPYKLTYLRQNNQGPASARNRGIRKARGEYLLFLNDDAIVEPGTLSIHHETLNAHKREKIAVLGRFSMLPEYTKSPFGYLLENLGVLFRYTIMQSGQLYIMQSGQLYDYNFFYTCNLSILRQIVLDVGMFDEDFTSPAGEDLELGYRLQKYGYRVFYEPKAVTWHDHLISPEGFCNIHKVRGDGSVTLNVKHPGLNWYKGLNHTVVDQWRQSINELSQKIPKILTEINKITRSTPYNCNPHTLHKIAEQISPEVELLQQYYSTQGSISSPLLERLIEICSGSTRSHKNHNSLDPSKLIVEAGRGLIKEPIRKDLSGYPLVVGKKAKEKSHKPMLSVIIPTRERADVLKVSLEALDKQTIPRELYAVVIIDDGSGNTGYDWIKGCGYGYQIKVLNQDKKGPAAARNLGIRNAEGGLLLFMNDDAIADPRLLEEHLKAHNKNEDSKVAVLGGFHLAEYKESLFMSLLENTDLLMSYRDMKPGQLYDFNYFWTCNISVPREDVIRVGLFDEDFTEPMTEDVEFGYRLEKMGYKVLYWPEAYCEHKHSFSFASFCQKQLMCGRNFVRLVTRHPEIMVQAYGVDHFTPEILDIFRKDLATDRHRIDSFEGLFHSIEGLRIKDYAKVSEIFAHTFSSLEECFQILGPLIWQIRHYHWKRGVLQAMEARDITVESSTRRIQQKTSQIPTQTPRKVLLSNPPWFAENGAIWGIRAGSRWPFTTEVGCPYYPYPFLLGYATSCLLENGINAWMVDSILSRESLASYYRRIQEIQFDYVVIETSTPSSDKDLVIAQEVARYSKVILTGPHATVFADELATKPYIHAVLKGEYEKNLLEAVRSGKPGIYDYDLVEDIDSLPYPYRDSTIYRYCDRFPVTPAGPALQMWGSRGCPYRCIFCLWPPVMYKGKFRMKRPGAIIREIEEVLAAYPRFTSIYFDDDTFNIGKDRIWEICDGLKQIGLPWAAMCRADTVDVETFRIMKDSGCYAVKFGVESGCQELVDRCQKKLDLKTVEENIREVRKMGIFVHTTFTFGLPGESIKSIKATQRFYRHTRPDSYQQSCCTPFPGTPFYDIWGKANISNSDSFRWDKLDGNKGCVMGGNGLSAEEITSLGKVESQCFVWGRMLRRHMGPWLVKAAQELGYRAFALDNIEPHPVAISLLLKASPLDMFIADRGVGLTPDILKLIKAKKVLYYPDILPTLYATNLHAGLRYAEFRNIAPYFDYIVLHDDEALPYLIEKGHKNIVGKIVLPFEATLHKKIPLPKEYDLLFFGTPSEYRQSWLAYIEEKYPVFYPTVFEDELVRVINRSRIILNLHYTPLPNTEHRVIEAMACGAFVLSEPLADRDLFEEGKELVYFDKSDVFDKIGYYLYHEEEREEIASWAWQKVTAHFSAKDQLKNLLELCGEEV